MCLCISVFQIYHFIRKLYGYNVYVIFNLHSSRTFGIPRNAKFSECKNAKFSECKYAKHETFANWKNLILFLYLYSNKLFGVACVFIWTLRNKIIM